MQFWDIEVIPYPKLHEDLLICMEALQDIVQEVKGLGCVYCVLCHVHKVKNHANCLDEPSWRVATRKWQTNDQAQKESTNIGVFLSGESG